MESRGTKTKHRRTYQLELHPVPSRSTLIRRHRTLRSAVVWSKQLNAAIEQVALPGAVVAVPVAVLVAVPVAIPAALPATFLVIVPCPLKKKKRWREQQPLSEKDPA